MGMTDVYAAILPALAFKPVFHVHYAESVLPLHDGLAKFRDMPKEVGGSGETMPECVTVAPGVAFGRALSSPPGPRQPGRRRISAALQAGP